MTGHLTVTTAFRSLKATTTYYVTLDQGIMFLFPLNPAITPQYLLLYPITPHQSHYHLLRHS